MRRVASIPFAPIARLLRWTSASAAAWISISASVAGRSTVPYACGATGRALRGS
jgi:hypothetical protein